MRYTRYVSFTVIALMCFSIACLSCVKLHFLDKIPRLSPVAYMPGIFVENYKVDPWAAAPFESPNNPRFITFHIQFPSLHSF